MLIRDRRPGGPKGRGKSKQSEGIVWMVGVHFFFFQIPPMIHILFYCLPFWLGYVSSLFLLQQLLQAWECPNAKQRFILGQIAARGARASWVHHCRTHRSGARLCSEALCYLAYFSSISNGPLPNRSSSCEPMVDRGLERVERISQRENGQPCQGRGPPRPEWHTLNRWQGPECWPTEIHRREGWSHTGREYRTALSPFLWELRTDMYHGKKRGLAWMNRTSRAQTSTARIRICVLVYSNNQMACRASSSLHDESIINPFKKGLCWLWPNVRFWL